jgi:nicotinamidase-related amidase/GNAT superfamily N-acetyltransferase
MNRKALVVIDIQNDITKHYRDIIDRLNTAIEWAAESGMEIVYIQHNNLSAGTRTLKPGTKGAELVPELRIVSDHIFVKTKANALTSEEFSEFIRAKDIREFYITGADATGCVKSTCFNMAKAGYAVHVISDCVTSYDLKKMPEMLAYYTDKGCEVKNLAIYMGIKYQYKKLDNHNFTGHSLDDFIRHQTVTACWRKINNDWKLVPNVYEENWSQVQCREIAEDVVHHINLDQTGFGAFHGERIIGFATISHRIFGTAARHVELVCLQISEEYRRQGIGRRLFFLACEEARRLGADKLYISAHSSKESQAAYRALGCSFAEEINEELAAAEPFDVQLEYKL